LPFRRCCEYSAKDGHPGRWHLVHLGSRAVGGAALVMTEATAVQSIGRISPWDTGIYLDAHVESWKAIADFVWEQGAIPACSSLTQAEREAPLRRGWVVAKFQRMKVAGSGGPQRGGLDYQLSGAKRTHRRGN